MNVVMPVMMATMSAMTVMGMTMPRAGRHGVRGENRDPCHKRRTLAQFSWQNQ